jgi:DNA-binding FadR family transcriptional regulator
MSGLAAALPSNVTAIERARRHVLRMINLGQLRQSQRLPPAQVLAPTIGVSRQVAGRAP